MSVKIEDLRRLNDSSSQNVFISRISPKNASQGTDRFDLVRDFFDPNFEN